MEFDFSVLIIPHGIKRLDQYCSTALGITARNQLARNSKGFLVNGKPAKASRTLHTRDRICFSLKNDSGSDVIPEEIPLSIIYEDTNVTVLNKPQGMVVHPGAGNRNGTLSNALMHHVSGLEDIDGRPGIVHRLDKETSGVIITARHVQAQDFLAAQFRSRVVDKVYLAVVAGKPPKDQGIIEGLMTRSRQDRRRFELDSSNGRHSKTSYKVLRAYKDYSFLVLKPETGRTHQLRVHMRWLGCPIAGDPIYGRRNDQTPSLMLHAYRLSIVIPGNKSKCRFRAALPDRFKSMLLKLAKNTIPPATTG